ncbi:hypothetical protein BDP55DRAFT_631861 [Colletotrichum godetiae]|uniref:Uncharacterized protein n=1 Tax=Colletotrichum godetiae TaxID=1209918 RepID=A0AAJ0EU18_9PEZI|nr:uncharacterized protein BDP55DRAFT_631861 [Colletotrichum godetiae]KAK1675667.1 hypothetical protein BDP55DRAFT_631861 [Colletotrichum godetiae]
MARHLGRIESRPHPQVAPPSCSMAKVADMSEKGMLSSGTPPEPIPSRTPVSYADQCGSETPVRTNTVIQAPRVSPTECFVSKWDGSWSTADLHSHQHHTTAVNTTFVQEGKSCREGTHLCTVSKQDGMPAISPHHPLWATQPQLRLVSLRAFSITLASLPDPSLSSVSECRPRGATWNVAIAKKLDLARQTQLSRIALPGQYIPHKRESKTAKQRKTRAILLRIKRGANCPLFMRCSCQPMQRFMRREPRAAKLQQSLVDTQLTSKVKCLTPTISQAGDFQPKLCPPKQPTDCDPLSSIYSIFLFTHSARWPNRNA